MRQKKSLVGSTSIDDVQSLVRGCLSKDRESQKLLYRHFYGYAMSVCLRFASSTDDALEILNDGFMKVFNKTDKYNPKKSFKGWLRRIMINTALDHYRKNLKHSYHAKLNGNEPVFTHESVMDKLSYEEIIALIQKLSPAYRAVFNLYVIDGYRHDEIARILHISVGTSKSNLSKARANLRSMLQKFENHKYARYPG